jgi:DNA-binding transcriptional LysR family regulator
VSEKLSASQPVAQDPNAWPICSLVEQGHGVAVLSQAMWRSVTAAPRLREVKIADRWAKRRLVACSPRTLARDPDLRRIFDTVVEAFSAPQMQVASGMQAHI